MRSKIGAEFMAKNTFIFIFAIITLVLLGPISIGFFGSGDVFADVACKGTVTMADQTYGVFPIFCFTKDTVSDETDEVKVMEVIAESMRSCWSQWGEGEKNPKGKNWLRNEDFKCFKCERLKFPEYDNNVPNKKISAVNFRDFLKDSDIKVKGYKGTYMNYFKKSVVFGFKENEYFGDMVRSDDEYAVTFVENIEERVWIQYGSMAVAGAASGGSIGAGLCMVGIVTAAATPACAAIGAGIGGLSFLVIQGVDDVREWTGNG